PVAPRQKQPGVAGQQVEDQLAVIQEVGGEIQPAAPPQQAENQIGRLRIEEPPLVMAAFRPGIGEIDMQRRGEAGRQHGRDQVLGLAPQGDPVGEPPPPGPLDEEAVVLAGQLDAEKAAAGVLLAAAEQIAALAEADLHLPFAAPSHQMIEGERRRQAGERTVRRRGGNQDGLDQRRSSRFRAASSETSLLTSCERDFGHTRTASPVRTTTRPSTPSTAIVPASAKRRLSRASTASRSPRPVLPWASRGRTSSRASQEPRSL